jgi:hypothetical protein
MNNSFYLHDVLLELQFGNKIDRTYFIENGLVEFLNFDGVDFEFTKNVFSFVVLSYAPSSSLIKLHQIRSENLKNILHQVVKLEKLNDELLSVLIGTHPLFISIRNWYIDDIKDWRWIQIVSNAEYFSDVQKMKVDYTKPKEAIDIGKCLEEAAKRMKHNVELIDQIEKDYATTDSALEKDFLQKITSAQRGNTTSLHSYNTGK